MNEDEIRKAVADPYHTQPTVFYICDHKACDHPCYEECNHTSNICHAKCPDGVYILSDDGTSLWQKTCQEFAEKSQTNVGGD